MTLPISVVTSEATTSRKWRCRAFLIYYGATKQTEAEGLVNFDHKSLINKALSRH